MQYFISFLEGVITFISPCLLPMLPVYISYFAGGESGSKKTIVNALGFVLGFTMVFVAMGAIAGIFGALLTEYKSTLDIVTGTLVVLFGLNFLGVFKLNMFKGGRKKGSQNLGFCSSLLFGVTFSVCWTPCVGAFLGSALMLAASNAHMGEGILMLLCYSVGLGIPFFASAVLIDKLKGTFAFIKCHYTIVNAVSGSILVLVRVVMMAGIFGRILTILS